jgi:DegV family protein with EDD domain
LASAIQAKNELPSLNIELVDSRSTSMGLGMQVLTAARAAREGQPMEIALEQVQHVRDNMYIIFAVDTLEYLHRGGRIGGAARLLGTALNLKPVLHLEDGKVMPLEKVRMRRKSLQRVVEIVKEKTNGRRLMEVAVIHAQAGEDADLVVTWIKELFAPEVMYSTILTPVVGTHAGPGTIGVAFYVAD